MEVLIVKNLFVYSNAKLQFYGLFCFGPKPRLNDLVQGSVEGWPTMPGWHHPPSTAAEILQFIKLFCQDSLWPTKNVSLNTIFIHYSPP